MKANKISPGFIRYLKPRLQPVSRPIFWGTLSILSLLGVIIYQYGRYSDWLETDLEKTTNSGSLSSNNLAPRVGSSHLSPEKLAIRVDIGNLDLLLQEINQNQNFPLNLSSNSQENSETQNSEDKTLNRFQAKQQPKSERFSLVSNSLPNSQNNLINKSFLDSENKLPHQLIKKKSTLISSINNNINSQFVSPSNLLSNPVGRLYLSNRQQLFSSNQPLSKEKNLAHSVNPLSSTEVNSVPSVISPLTTNDSLHGLGAEPKTQTDNTSTTPLVNRFQPINKFPFECAERVEAGTEFRLQATRSGNLFPDGLQEREFNSHSSTPQEAQCFYLKENANNAEKISLPSSQHYNYLQTIDNLNHSEVNSNSLQLQPHNLTNYQIQPLNFYQLHPSNYQLQPQKLERLEEENLNLPSQSNSSVSKE
ncbi:hypothetical protein IQ238_07290 [Pleurocapsales cyanobacterium LEGE 06147]|nr:hypothetical protein [Pleurocapsales cyanobacterium LEGE 06147]